MRGGVFPVVTQCEGTLQQEDAATWQASGGGRRAKIWTGSGESCFVFRFFFFLPTPSEHHG